MRRFLFSLSCFYCVTLGVVGKKVNIQMRRCLQRDLIDGDTATPILPLALPASFYGRTQSLCHRRSEACVWLWESATKWAMGYHALT